MGDAPVVVRFDAVSSDSPWPGLLATHSPGTNLTRRRETEAMLREVAARLAGTDRFGLWIVELDGRPIGAQVFVSAGPVLSYVSGGFDPDFAEFAPGIVGLARAIEDALERGQAVMDFGVGSEDYKSRFADADRPVALELLAPAGAWTGLARASLPRRGSTA